MLVKGCVRLPQPSMDAMTGKQQYKEMDKATMKRADIESSDMNVIRED